MKKILLALVLIGCAGAAIGYYMFQKEHDSTADIMAAHSVSVDGIIADFLADEPGASTKYIEQVIEVSGPVLEVIKVDGKVAGVKLGSDEFNLVNCSFQDTTELADMPSTLVVKGVCSGFMGDAESMLPGGTVELKRAVIVQPQ